MIFIAEKGPRESLLLIHDAAARKRAGNGYLSYVHSNPAAGCRINATLHSVA